MGESFKRLIIAKMTSTEEFYDKLFDLDHGVHVSNSSSGGSLSSSNCNKPVPTVNMVIDDLLKDFGRI